MIRICDGCGKELDDEEGYMVIDNEAKTTYIYCDDCPKDS